LAALQSEVEAFADSALRLLSQPLLHPLFTIYLFQLWFNIIRHINEESMGC